MAHLLHRLYGVDAPGSQASYSPFSRTVPHRTKNARRSTIFERETPTTLFIDDAIGQWRRRTKCLPQWPSHIPDARNATAFSACFRLRTLSNIPP